MMYLNVLRLSLKCDVLYTISSSSKSLVSEMEGEVLL